MDSIRLGQDCVYLAASKIVDRRGGHFEVGLLSSLSAVLDGWQASTRLSPIWPLTAYAGLRLAPVQPDEPFTGQLVFLGPIRPHQALDECVAPHLGRPTYLKHVCLSLGIYNVLLFLSADAQAGGILETAERIGANWERWTILRGALRDTQHAGYRPLPGSWRNVVRELANDGPWAPPLAGAMEEYLPLLASALARSEAAAPDLTESLAATTAPIRASLRDPDEDPFLKQSHVTHTNAALSRMTSQMFSGISPILTTECHYWIHSLLGTGAANLGLRNLTKFIADQMGEFMLPQRLEALRTIKVPAPPNLPKHAPHAEAALKHYLDELPISPPVVEPTIPLLSYFSGRDGFKSNLTTISVPLSTVSNANATPWTLQTLTHEISHIVVETVLQVVLPGADLQDRERALDLLKTGHIETWFDTAAHLLLNGILSLDFHARNRRSLDVSPDDLAVILQSRLPEVAEIIVHVFDFMYFYGSDVPAYVKGIWTSWSAIPDIESRIPEYIDRTTCAIVSRQLTRADPVPVALESVRAILVGLPPEVGYASYAADYIEAHRDEMHQSILARLHLVQFVRSFLYSPRLASQLQADSLTVGGRSRSDGYVLRQGELSRNWIGNPLTYVASFTTSPKPSAVESMLLWQALAHSIARGSPPRSP